MGKEYHLEAEPGEFSAGGSGVSMRVDAFPLLHSRTRFCFKLLNEKRLEDLAEEEKIEFLLALHIILEAGIGGAIRSLVQHISHIDFVKTKDLVDELSLIDKVKSLLCYWRFTLRDGEASAAEEKAESFIEKLKKFTEARNRIIHGHAVAETVVGGRTVLSRLRKLVSSDERISSQSKDFLDCVDSFCFFVDRANIEVGGEQRRLLLEHMFDVEFLEKLRDAAS